MSFVKDTFFGGAEKDAAKQQTRALGESQEFIREAVTEARGDIMPLFGGAQQNLLSGFGGALDVLNQISPQQIQALQAGNVGAQQTLLSGQQQAQNAILGGNVNLQGALQPQTINVDPIQAQLPDFISAQDALNPPPPPPRFNQNNLTGQPFTPFDRFGIGRIPFGRNR